MAGEMIDSRITRFLKKHHVLTVATCVDNVPWCANCFYAYLEDENAFVFTSDAGTRHGKEFIMNSRVSGSVVLETMIVGKIRGVQFSGMVREVPEELMKKAKFSYLKRFPVAALMDTKLWILRPDHIKMTDNRLGFGKKLIWNDSGLSKMP